MIKRYIGIDIEESCLSAVQLMRTDQQFCIDKVFRGQINSNLDSIPSILKTLISEHGFDQRAGIAVSLPDDAVFFRSLKSESFGDQPIDAISESTLKHIFPMQSDNVIAQICPNKQLEGENTSVLIAAAKRDSFYDRLNVLKTAKMYPKGVEARIFAVHSTVMINHPEMAIGRVIIAYLNKSHLILAIVQDNQILMVRNILLVSCSDDTSSIHLQQVAKVILCEASITWQKVFGGKIKDDTRIYLAKGSDVSVGLEVAVKQTLNCRVVAVNPYAKIKSSLEHNGQADICVAEGLALDLSLRRKSTGINFLEVEESNIKPTINLKKEIITYATLLVAIAVILIGGLLLRVSRLESEYNSVKNEIDEVFKQTLPSETNIVNPLVQLDQKLQLLKKSYTLFSPVSATRLSPLEVFHAISTSIPSQANISSMLIGTESVRLAGNCQSFESVYIWQRSLEENQGFANIDLQNVKKDSQGQKVNFTMLISLTAGGTQ